MATRTIMCLEVQDRDPSGFPMVTLGIECDANPTPSIVLTQGDDVLCVSIEHATALREALGRMIEGAIALAGQ